MMQSYACIPADDCKCSNTAAPTSGFCPFCGFWTGAYDYITPAYPTTGQAEQAAELKPPPELYKPLITLAGKKIKPWEEHKKYLKK